MKKPENQKELLEKRAKAIKRIAIVILNKGIIAKEPSGLRKTLDNHEQLKILLNELDYTLAKDISDEDKLAKIDSVERKVKKLKDGER